MPLTFYQYTEAANNVTIEYTYGTDPTRRVAQIRNGNYVVVADMISALNAAFDAAQIANGDSAGDITANPDNVTGKIYFLAKDEITLYLTPVTPTSAQCGVALTTKYTTWWGLGYFLGFTAATQVSEAYTAIPTFNYILVPQFALNLYPINYVLLDIAQLNKIDETSLDDRKGSMVNGSFAKILCDGNPYDYIYLTDTGAYQLNRTVFNPPISKLATLSVKFRLHDGRVLDFNGVENSFTIELEMLDNNFDEFSSVEFGPY
jgi:hypothetical protein